MKNRWMKIAALLAVAPGVMSAVDRRPLGEIDFFGGKGFDLAAIRSALPFHEGDLFPPASAKHSNDLKRQVSEAVGKVIGRPPTDIAFDCLRLETECDGVDRLTRGVVRAAGVQSSTRPGRPLAQGGTL